MTTTLYGHKILGTDSKPLVPNIVLKQICEDLEKGDKKYYEEVKDQWTFEASQQRTIQTLYNKIVN